MPEPFTYSETSVSRALPPRVSSASVTARTNTDDKLAPFHDGKSPSFKDFIDVLNPLQHIPGINTLYRKITGDQEGTFADITGGLLYGGPIGMAAAMINVGVKGQTGSDIGDHVYAMVTGKPAATDAGTAIASAATPASTAAANPPAGSSLTTALAAQQLPPVPAVAPAPRVAASPVSANQSAANQSAGTQPPKPQQTAMADGIGRAGDFMVFGARPIKAATSTGTSALSALYAPPAAPVTPAVATASAAGAPSLFSPAVATAPANTPAALAAASQPAQGKDGFMVFGAAGAAPATSLPVAGQPQGSAISGASAGGSNPAGQGPTAQGNAAQANAGPAGNGLSRFRPVPPRTGPSAPPGTLPPPTTGPGAMPGGQSQATGTSSANGVGSWFVNAFNQGMDRYGKDGSVKDGSGKDGSGKDGSGGSKTPSADVFPSQPLN